MSLKNRFRGWLGEKIVGLINWAFLNSKIYRQLNNVTIELPDGSTTQMDHLIVSIYGIFVVETKNMSGDIFGGENDRKWTQRFPSGKTFQFQNPIKQNLRHQYSLIEFLNVRVPELGLTKADIEQKLFSVVFFGPDANVKTPEKLPDSVMEGSITYIKSKTVQVFSESQVDEIVDCVKDGKLPAGLISGMGTHKRHVASLKERHHREAGDACPRCGESLVERKRKSDGQSFVGCSGYPKCRYVRSDESR